MIVDPTCSLEKSIRKLPVVHSKTSGELKAAKAIAPEHQAGHLKS